MSTFERNKMQNKKVVSGGNQAPKVSLQKKRFIAFLFYHKYSWLLPGFRGVSCLATLIYSLVATALGFLVLGGVGFNDYLLVSTIWPPPKPFPILDPPLDGKFSVVKGPIVTGR